MYKLVSATIEITRKCNAKCIHCIVDAGKEQPNELTTSEIIKLIEDMSDYNPKYITLTGGEPFSREDWPLYLQKITSLGIKPMILTNGMLINDDVINILRLYPALGIGISLDGANKETHDYIRGVNGIFEHFCKIVPKLRKTGLYVGIPTTVMQSNYNQLDDILKLLLELKVSTWQLQTVKPNKRLPEAELLTEEQFYKLAEKIAFYRENYSDKIKIVEADCIGYYSLFQDKLYMKNWRGCECGIYSCSIESDGNVKGCPNMNNSEGNIRNRSFKEIWEDHNSFKYNRSPSVENLKGYCVQCKHKYVCRGGCPQNVRCKSGGSYCLYKIEQKGYD